MSIEFFQEGSSLSLSKKPFVEEYVELHPQDTALYLVTSVRRTRKRTGYMVNTDKFAVFLFEGSAILSQLMEALAEYHQSGHGYKIFCQPCQEDPYYKLGVDLDQPTNWLAERGKYFIASEASTTGSEEQQKANPFLPPPSTGKHRKKTTT